MGKRKKAPKQGFVTRQQLCIRFGVSIATVRTWQRKGILRGERIDGRWYFGPREVEEADGYLKACRPRRVGEEVARAYELFRDGATLQDVVIALRVTMARAVTLQQEYHPGGVYLEPADVATLSKALRRRGFRHPEHNFTAVVLQLCERDNDAEKSRFAALA